jgi:hypothetical protein
MRLASKVLSQNPPQTPVQAWNSWQAADRSGQGERFESCDQILGRVAVNLESNRPGQIQAENPMIDFASTI